MTAAQPADTSLGAALSLVGLVALVAAPAAALAPKVVAWLPRFRAGAAQASPAPVDDRSGRVDVEVDGVVAAPGDQPAPADTAGPPAAPRVAQPYVPPPPPPPTTTDPAAVDWDRLAASRGLSGWCALTAAVSAGAVAWVLGPDPSLPAWTALCVVGTWLAWIDWRTRLLPKRLVIPAYVLVGLLLLLGGVGSGEAGSLGRALVGWVATFGVYWVLWLIHPRGLGYGDVRLSGLLGLALGWIGWPALLAGTYAGFLLGAVIGGVLSLARVVDRHGYPFGPFMLAGAWLGAVTSPLTAGWF